MNLPFLKVSPEESVAEIQSIILTGYQLKDAISAEYQKVKTDSGDTVVKAEEVWKLQYIDWVNTSMVKLEQIYESPVYSYNFRDALPMDEIVMVENKTFGEILRGVQFRIERLNEYERFIRMHVPIQITVNAGRDAYMINGDNANVETNDYQQ